MALYQPPAAIDDFSRSTVSGLSEQWNDYIVSVLTELRDPEQNDLASGLFYDQLGDASGVADSPPVGIPWNGFPKRLTKWFDEGSPQEQEERANRAAEMLLSKPVLGLYEKDGTPVPVKFRVTDEYCEWHVEREGEKIRRISYTCEAPEYWEFLAERDFKLVHQLYKELLHNNAIPADDLRWPRDVYFKRADGQLAVRYRKGDYCSYNVWNTERGAVHLTHPSNSLYGEMALASASTVLWPVAPGADGTIDDMQLLCCNGAGGINRSSDPLIVRGVFSLVRQGLSVALANPIGLYMAPFALDGLLDPDENSIGAQALKVVRRSPDGTNLLRVEVSAPAGANFTLDQCTLDGKALRYGGQIARAITMRLFGVGKKIPGSKGREISTCPTFCCTHPRHPQFRGTFSLDRLKTCGQVTEADWQQEAYDIPTLPPDVAGLESVEMEPAPLKPMKPAGRKAIVDDLEWGFRW